MKKNKVTKLRKFKRKGIYVFFLLLIVLCVSPIPIYAGEQEDEDKNNEIVYTYTTQGKQFTGTIYKPHKHKRLYRSDPVDFRKKLHVNIHVRYKDGYEECNNFHIWKEKSKTGKNCIAIWDSKNRNSKLYKSTGLNNNKYLKICGGDWKKQLVSAQEKITENAAEFLGKIFSAKIKKQWIAMIQNLFKMLMILVATIAIFALCLI